MIGNKRRQPPLPNPFALKRKLIPNSENPKCSGNSQVSAPNSTPPTIPEKSKPSTPKLTMESCVPKNMGDIFGNARCKQTMSTWLQNKGVTLCLLSGPTGCGKTSLAQVAIRKSGREVVDLRRCDDMEIMLTDLLFTPGKNAKVGVIIDELENMVASNRTKLLKLLTQRNPTVPVVSICTDPRDKCLVPYVKACGTHIRMEKPTPQVSCALIGKLAPTLGTPEKNSISKISNGDLRQTAILTVQVMNRKFYDHVVEDYRAHVRSRYANLESISSKYSSPNPQISNRYTADRRVNDIFTATKFAFASRNREDVLTCVTYSNLVPPMIQEHLVERAQKKKPPSSQQDFSELEDLVTRLETMSSGDLMDSHPMHQTHELASNMYSFGCMGQSGFSSKSPGFPKAIGLSSKRGGWESTFSQVSSTISPRFMAHEDSDMVTTLLNHKFSHDPAFLKQTEKKVSKPVVKKFRNYF